MHPLPAKVIVPREAGLLHFGVRSTYILGLQIGTQFCPGFIAPSRFAKAARRSEAELSFFVAWNVRNVCSLTSTYRVVRIQL